MAKLPALKFVSPKGELNWVTITGEGKENMSGQLKYTAAISVAQDDSIIKKLEEFWAANKPAGFKKKAKSLGYRLADPLKDADGNVVKDDEDMTVYDKDGSYALTFSTNTTWPDGKPTKVRTFNSKAREVALGDTQIGNGSIGQISGTMAIYVNEVKGKIMDAGVTLYLGSIKISKLVEFTQDAGFEAEDGEEDGFTGVGEDNDFDGTEEAPTSAAKPRL